MMIFSRPDFKDFRLEFNEKVGFSTSKNAKIHIFQFLKKRCSKKIGGSGGQNPPAG